MKVVEVGINKAREWEGDGRISIKSLGK